MHSVLLTRRVPRGAGGATAVRGLCDEGVGLRPVCWGSGPLTVQHGSAQIAWHGLLIAPSFRDSPSRPSASSTVYTGSISPGCLGLG